MVVLEVFRLGSLLVAHRQLGIPPEWRFVLKALELEWEGPPPQVPALGAIWCELTVDVSVELSRRERSLLTWRCALIQDGRTLAIGRLQGWVMAPRRYRSHRKAAGTATDAKANRAPRRLLAPADGGWTVSWDGRDGVLAAVHADHVPPLVLADAALSATRLRSPDGQVHLFEMAFPGFAERGSPVALGLTWDAESSVNVFSVRQGEHTVATARVQVLGHAALDGA
jgi:hypothetical protein